MKQAMKPVWGLFAALLAVVVVSVLVKASRPGEIIPWRATLAAAQEEARGAQKPVLVYFTATWCGPCQNLKHTTWADANVASALQRFVPVKVDIDEHSDLAGAYNVDSVPTFVVLDGNAQVVGRWVGASPPQEFIDELKRTAPAPQAGS